MCRSVPKVCNELQRKLMYLTKWPDPVLRLQKASVPFSESFWGPSMVQPATQDLVQGLLAKLWRRCVVLPRR